MQGGAFRDLVPLKILSQNNFLADYLMVDSG